MKKASRLNYLIAGIVSAISIFSIIGALIYFIVLGFVMGAIFGIISIFSNIYIFLEAGLPTMLSMWFTAFCMIPSLITPIVFTILGFLGSSKLGNKKPLVIVNFVFGILGVLKLATLPGLFLLEGSIFGLSALDEEKKAVAEQAELELQQVEDILEQ